MQRTNIFIASSSEMRHERLELVDLFTDMCSDTMEYIPVKWEYMDSSVHKEHKQSEYMRRLKKCEICMVMFWRSLGKYTEKELYLALDEQSKGNHLQKTFILFKEDGESVSAELSEFKKKCVQQHSEIVHSFANSQELRELAKNLVLSANVKCNESKWEGKEVKVMIAADEELNEEKLEFTELMAHLNEVLENRGIRLRRVKWTPQGEDDFRKELHDCEMCLNLYWTQLPRQADEEMKVAYNLSTNGANPQHLYIFFKEKPSDKISAALADFKAGFETVYGHFFCKFENVDTMNLHFILQFEAKQNILERNSVKVENGDIVIDTNHFIDMDKLPFVALNEGYKKIKEELEVLPEDIKMCRLLVDEHPEQSKYREQLQKKLDRYNASKEELARLQQTLFATAKRVAEIQLEEVSSELQRAINEFEAGHVEAANAILDGIEREAEESHLRQLDCNRALVHKDIKALLLKTTVLMTDICIPIEERIQRTWAIYRKADDWAERSAFPTEEYARLLGDYGRFLYDYSRYEEAIIIWKRECLINKDIYGKNHPIMACSYNKMGMAFHKKGEFEQAQEYHSQALKIRKKLLGLKHPETAESYNNIGLVYRNKGIYNRALSYYKKALKIWAEVLGEVHPDTATAYNNIGMVYLCTGDYDNAIAYFGKDLKICLETLGEKHPSTATSYYNIGEAYDEKGDYNRALENNVKALRIREEVLGREHHETAESYNNIGGIYFSMDSYDQALDYYQKALKVFLKTIGENHPHTKEVQESIEVVLEEMSKRTDDC